MKKFIDTSSYNGTVNFKEAKKQGVDGAILKIIRKDLQPDNQFYASQKACESNGLPWGVYNYSYATTVEKAKSDMKLICDMLDKLDKKYFKLGVWFDIEDQAQATLGKTTIAKILNAAQEVVEARGYRFGIYTGQYYYKEHMDAAQIKCKNWWIARYYKGYDEMPIGTDPDEKYKPISNCWAWQYTSSGTFKPAIATGNGGHFDISVQYKEFSSKTTPGKPTKKAYSGTFPTLPTRGYFKNGDKGSQVKNLQKFLNWYGGYGLTTDGIIGPKTIAAIKKFQTAVKIKSTPAGGESQQKQKTYKP